MKILFLCPSMIEMGTYFRCYHFARCLVKKGHDVTLLKTSTDSKLKFVRKRIEGIRQLETPRFWGANYQVRHLGYNKLPLDIASRIVHVISNRYDVIHAFAHQLNVYAPWKLARWFGKASIFVSDWDDQWTEGGFYGSYSDTHLSKISYRMEAGMEKKIRLEADGVSAISQALSDKTESMGVMPDRILLLPVGADIDSIQPISIQTARKQLQVDYRGNLLVFAGFVQHEIEIVFQALKILVDKGIDVRLLLVGPFSSETEEKAKHLGIRNFIISTGPVPYTELPIYLNAGDIALMPYTDSIINRYAFPNKLGDYIAAGKPVVAGDTGDVKRFFNTYQVGLLAKDHAEDYADKIAWLIHRPEMQQTYGKEARRVAEEEMSWDIHTDKLEQFYQKLLQKTNNTK
jgi:glycosyltransferase involved in cell wall biosynthesis